MNAHLIERHFAKIGARAKVRSETRRNRTGAVTIDIGHDGDGEFFDIALGREANADRAKIQDYHIRVEIFCSGVRIDCLD